MKIALITPGYAPTLGGVEAVVTALGTGLARRGIEVEVWTHAAAGTEAGNDWLDGVVVRRFPSTRSHRFPVSAALMAHARRHSTGIDVLHAHSYHSTAALAALRAPASVPVVFSPHYHGGGHTFMARLMHPVYRPLGRRLVARADRIVAVSDAERQLLTNHFPSCAGRCTVVANAVDVDAIHAATPRPDEPPTALVLGRLESYKRVGLVLDAFGAASSPGQLVIIGDGPARPHLEASARVNSRSDDIRFLGRLPRSEVDAWLRTAQCVVSMSEHEAFGIVGLEGIAAGCRVLLSDLPAHREVITLAGGDAAKIVAPSALPAALDRAMASPRSAPRLVRDWSTVIDEHLSVYDEAVRQRA